VPESNSGRTPQPPNKRADYLKSVLSAAPILGTEYATLRGNLLLQVSSKLTPFVADQYKAAFTA